MKIRTLPLAIAAMGALAAVKTASLAGSAGWSAAPEAHASAAHASAAQDAPRSAASPSAPAPAASARPAASAVPAANCPPAAGSDPPVSAAERSALQELRSRRGQLDAREQQVAVKESVLAAAEKRIADRVKELADLQARLQTMEDARKKREEADWQGLVRTYEAMRPRDAAAIMNGMETPVLLEVFDRMSDRKAALVLAAMPPDRARAVTIELAEKRLKASQPVQVDQ